MSETHQPTPRLPDDEQLRAAWREAITAYRASMRAGDRTTATRQKAVVALMQIASGISHEQAAVELTRALDYVRTHHPDWLWRRGV